MAGEHALFSASGAHRWAHCLGQLAFCKGMADKPSSYAAEGTVYHEIAAAVLSGDLLDAYALVGTKREADGFTFVVTRENLDHMMKYVNAVRELKGAKLYEVELDTSAVVGVEGQFGTGDCVHLSGGLFDPETLDFTEGEIGTEDLKFGAGKKVAAYTPPPGDLPRWTGLNDQLMIYLCAAYLAEKPRRKITRGRIGIHQPRFGAEGNFDAVNDITAEEMEAFIAWITDRARKARALMDAPRDEVIRNLTPSEKACEFCPKKLDCPARTQKLLDDFPLVQQIADTGSAENLSDELIGELRSKVELWESVIKDIKSEAYQRAMMGRRIPGWRIAEGKLGDRKFEDPAAVKAAVNDYNESHDGDRADVYTAPDVIGPAEAERRFKKDHPKLWALLNGNPDKKTKEPTAKSFIVRPLGGKTLVRDFSSAPHIPQPGSGEEFGLVSPIQEFM